MSVEKLDKRERLDKRFGVVAVESGFITPEQLYEALKTQVMEELEGAKRRLVGQILFKMGYITSAQVEEVLIFMGIK